MPAAIRVLDPVAARVPPDRVERVTAREAVRAPDRAASVPPHQMEKVIAREAVRTPVLEAINLPPVRAVSIPALEVEIRPPEREGKITVRETIKTPGRVERASAPAVTGALPARAEPVMVPEVVKLPEQAESIPDPERDDPDRLVRIRTWERRGILRRSMRTKNKRNFPGSHGSGNRRWERSETGEDLRRMHRCVFPILRSGIVNEGVSH